MHLSQCVHPEGPCGVRGRQAILLGLASAEHERETVGRVDGVERQIGRASLQRGEDGNQQSR